MAVSFSSLIVSARRPQQETPFTPSVPLNAPATRFAALFRQFLLGGALLAKPHIPRIAGGELSEIDQTSVRGLIDCLGITSKGITLDDAQTEAFICGLTQKVALIQGPPGARLALSFVSSPRSN